MAQGDSSWSANTRAFLQSSAVQMAQTGDRLIASGSKHAIASAVVLKYSNASLQGSVVTKELADTICTPPIQCNQEVISGGSEIRTDLFQVPQGINRQVSLEYEFY